MKIHGREIKFLRTVQATVEIEEVCPGEDISNLPQAMTGKLSVSTKVGARIIHALNKGYEMNKHFDDPSYEPHVLGEEEIMYLSNEDYGQLLNEAFGSINNGANTTIEVEESKKKKKKEATD